MRGGFNTLLFFFMPVDIVNKKLTEELFLIRATPRMLVSVCSFFTSSLHVGSKPPHTQGAWERL